MEEGSEKQHLMSRTEKEARAAISLATQATSKNYYVLANVLEDEGSYKEAKDDFLLSLGAARKIKNADDAVSSVQGVIRCADHLQQFDQADLLLAKLQQDGLSTTWDFSGHANRLKENGLYQRAGNAYLIAADMKGSPYTNWCSAASMYALSSQKDLVLSSARKCIDQGTGSKNSEENIGTAHRQIADVLNERGVYSEALSHSKEATALQSDGAFAYDDMAVALIGLRRFNEAVTAEGQAIRLSDGKFGWMHFNLASAYFELENWPFAVQSYRKAAELMPEDPAAAYDIALCHQRMGQFIDAAHWYQEYLKRKPDADDKAEILKLIGQLKN
jgi:tetratricopeptide (TPR) repeat protein